MKVLLSLILLSLLPMTASAHDADPVYDMCEKFNGGYPSLMTNCLKEFEDLYIDPAFGNMCEAHNGNYESLWKNCLKENANLKVARGFGRFCQSENQNYESLWKNCLRKNSSEVDDVCY